MTWAMIRVPARGWAVPPGLLPCLVLSLSLVLGLALGLVLGLPGAALGQGNPFLGGSPSQTDSAQQPPAIPDQVPAAPSQSGPDQHLPDSQQPDAQPDQDDPGPATPDPATPTLATPDPAIPDQPDPDQAAPSLVSRVRAWLVATQRDLNRFLSSSIRAFQEQGGGPIQVLALLAVSFAYGLLHALGPGHGKSVASAYFVSRGGSLRQGLFMGLATGLVHAASAVVLVLGIYWLLQGALSANFERASAQVTQASFACVALLGLVLVAGSLRRALGRDRHQEESPPRRHYLAVALVSGLIPCPGAALILFFTLALGAPLLGLACVAAMSLGMGLTIACAAMATVCFRGAVLRASTSRPGLWRGLGHGLSVAGSLGVFLLGSLLFLASL